jgi:NADH-quinone oxidoreductase subunit H
MDFGWKFLIPLTLANLFSAAVWVAFTRWGAAEGMLITVGWSPVLRWLAAFIITLAINIGVYLWLTQVYAASQAERRRVELEELSATL